MMAIQVRILVLEDSPADAELVIRSLKEAGYSCWWDRVETREDFLTKLRGRQYDLILADYSLPSFDGREALGLFLDLGLDIPFIFVSGVMGEERAIETLKAGATDYVLKARLSRLGPVVSRALEEKRGQRERRQAEQALEEGLRFIERVADASPTILYVYDLVDNRTVYTNGQITKTLGYTPEEIERMGGAFFQEVLHPEDRAQLGERIGGLTAARGGEVIESEYRLRHADGGWRWLSTWITVFSWTAAGSPHLILASAQDVTSHKQADEQIRKLSRAVEQSPIIVMITDTNGDIEYVNPKFTEVTGYPLDEVKGKNPRILKSGMVPPEEFSRLWQALAAGGEWRGEFVNMKKNGELFWVSASTSCVKDWRGEVTHYISVQEDVTDRKQAEAERRGLHEQLLQAQKMESIGRLAGGVAHDFNNLLTAIIGYSQLLMARLKAGDSGRRDIEEILKAGQRAAALTSQLLVFSRRQKVERRVVRLNDTVFNIMKMLRRIIGEDVEVRVVESERLSTVLADRAQIEQVIMNLAVNARDAMVGGGRFVIEIKDVTLDEAFCSKHLWARPGRYALLAVSDTGMGMDAETLQHIFEPFFTTKEAGKGTGLGLSLVYGIVQQYEGFIHCYSEPGRGTTFKIYLPIYENGLEQAISEEPVTLRGGAETILVAEDEVTLQGLIKGILVGLGYRVIMAGDGQEAVRLFEARREEIALVILDLVMPKMGGREAYELMQRIRSDVPFLFMTGYSTEVIQKRLLPNIDAPLIQKPYSVSDLSRKVREVLDQREENGR
jgi:PAS domain S-box-containing protein